MRIPLRRGRLITDADRAGAEEVMLIGEQTARTLWPNADPIGQHVRIGGADSGPWRTIVGVVGDVRHRALAAQPTMQMYTPQAQLTDSFLTIVIRSGVEPTALASVARQTIWSIAGDVPVFQVAALSDLVAKSVAPRRFVMILLGVFSAVALMMTAIGVYGVIRTPYPSARARSAFAPRSAPPRATSSGSSSAAVCRSCRPDWAQGSSWRWPPRNFSTRRCIRSARGIRSRSLS